MQTQSNSSLLGRYWPGIVAILIVVIIVMVSTPNLLRSRNASMHPYEYARNTSDPQKNAAVLDARRIVKMGTMQIAVKDPVSAMEELHAVARRVDAYVESSTMRGGGTTGGHVSMTLRMPVERFEEAMVEVRTLALQLRNADIESRDMETRAADLEAALRRYQADEQRYEQIMHQGGPLKDKLPVADKISSVRGEMENVRGQLQSLQKQREMASLTVIAAVDSEYIATPEWRPLAQAKTAFAAAKNDLAGYADFLFGFALRVPLIALWIGTILAIGVYGFRILRWMWRRLVPAATVLPAEVTDQGA